MIKRVLLLFLVLTIQINVALSLAENSILTLPSSLIEVEAETFEGDTAIQSAVIPSNVQTIGECAFANCTSLSSVSFESRSVVIADNAFEGSPVSFKAYQGSSADSYALSHGITVSYFESTVSFNDLALDLIMERGKPESGLMGEVMASERLLVQTDGSPIPDISRFDPVRVLSEEGTGFYVIQLNSISQATSCYEYLQENQEHIVFVEPDLFVTVNLSSEEYDEDVMAASLGDKWEDKDPMGLSDYADYIMENYPNAGATIAVIDSGVAMHPALNDYVISGYDFTGTGNPRVDGNNHGTSVAGTIVDALFNAKGKVKILPIKFYGGSFQTTLMIRQAIQKAIDCHPDVINISSVFNESAAVKSLLERTSIPVVVAAGNEKANCDGLFPAGLTSSNIITVSSIDTNMTRADHSNYGSSVDFCAPGMYISGYMSTGGTFNEFWGTSYAAPQISAAIALLSMDPRNNLDNLKNTCIDLGAIGKDQYYGWGLPNLRMLCDKVVSITITNELPTVMQVGGTSTLMYQINPDSAENKTVIFKSSDENVLNVSKSADGILRLVGLNQGQANVTITAQDGSGVSITTSDITVVQPVTRITIAGPSHEVNLAVEGETLGLSALVQPTNANNRAVHWFSSDESVATVAQNGVVTPVKEGTAIIRAESEDGFGAVGEYEITVIYLLKPNSIGFAVNSSSEMNVGDVVTFDLIFEPENCDKNVVWQVINDGSEKIMEVTNGTATALKPGKVTVNAVSKVDPSIFGHKEFNIHQPPTSIELTVPDDFENELDVGKSLQLNATVFPENADDTKVVWSSSNDSVATVVNGVVTGVASGSVVITATSNGNPEICETTEVITVKLLPSTVSIEGNEYAYLNDTTQLSAVILPENADDTSVTWSSEHPEIATVNSDGLVRGISEGNTVIKVSSNARPELTATISVSVFPEYTYYDWVREDLLPENAIVTDRKWTYTEKISSTNNNLSGWNLIGEEWRAEGSGARDYATFPSTYLTSNWIYNNMNVGPFTPFDDGSTKREVSNNFSGWVYWHYMYCVPYAAGTGRAISDRSGNWKADGSSGGYGYYYFYALKSAVDCPYLDNGYCCSRNQPSYNCHNIIPADADKSETSGLGTDRFFRFEYYTSYYTDYRKYYNYSRERTVTSEPVQDGNMSNIVFYVKYKVPNTSGIQLSGWVPESNLPEGAEIIEQRWSYKETVQNNSPVMDGFIQVASDWRQTDNGEVRWADFGPISGFDKGNSLYAKYNIAVPTDYEDTNTKRVVNYTVDDGYIYWHWMYSVPSNAYNRAIFYQYGYGSNTLTGNSYAYKFFGAFESANVYDQMGANTNWGQDDRYYLWYYVNDRTSNADTQGSYYWYRTQIHKTNYTDYSKLYTFTRTVTTTTEPVENDTISDVTKLVRYIMKTE